MDQKYFFLSVKMSVKETQFWQKSRYPEGKKTVPFEEYEGVGWAGFEDLLNDDKKNYLTGK